MSRFTQAQNASTKNEAISNSHHRLEGDHRSALHIVPFAGESDSIVKTTIVSALINSREQAKSGNEKVGFEIRRLR